MNLKPAVIASAAAAMLTLSACASSPGSEDGSTTSGPASSGERTPAGEGGASSEGEAPAEWGLDSGEGASGGESAPRPPVEQGDVDALGARLGDAGWGDGDGTCGGSVVDMAGYPKVVCIFPDEYAVPGQDANAVAVMTFNEWEQADAYMMDYGNPEVTVVKNGWMVDGPHSEAVDAAVEILEE